jgi:hypothetical protein
MKELSLHVLDLVQNSIQANATDISIGIEENSLNDSYEIIINDNGSGMDENTRKQVLDPFFTTKNKKTGLGIPLLKQHAELTGGRIFIQTKIGKGTRIQAVFVRSHIDRQPLGDITGTLISLIRSYTDIDFEYTHKVNQIGFTFSTKEVKQELEGISIASGEVIAFISELIKENLTELNSASI